MREGVREVKTDCLPTRMIEHSSRLDNSFSVHRHSQKKNPVFDQFGVHLFTKLLEHYFFNEKTTAQSEPVLKGSNC